MEDFVTIEIAKKLKEKGYNGRTNGRHVEKVPDTEREEWDDAEMMYVTVTDVVTTPRVRIWDALKWLREEKDVVVSVYPYYGKSVNVHWWWDIRTPVYKVEIESNIKQDGFGSYEQAALAGIEYVLDNLI